MQRWLRKRGSKLVPELIKSRIRGRFYGYRQSRVKLNYRLLRDNGDLYISIDNRIKFRVTEEAKEDFTYHFVQNGASIEEMFGFIKVAENARTLFDVGAHKGLFSLVFCACGNSKRAIAYEPSPSLSLSGKTLASINHFEQRMSIQNYAI